MKRIDSHDIAEVCGLSLMTFGFWMAWPPLSAIVLGGVLLAVPLLSRLRE